MNAAQALKDIGQELRQSNERDVNVQLERFRETLRDFLFCRGAFRSTGSAANLCHEVGNAFREQSHGLDAYEEIADAFDGIHDSVDLPYRNEE